MECIESQEDDDPRCVCGVYRSEHAMMGCADGFQTPAEWEATKRQMQADADRQDREERGFYDEDDEPDVDDDFPMSVEYDGLYGAPDFLIEQSAQDEAAMEGGLW